MIKVTIWNEYCHEVEDEGVRAVHPNGIHETLKAALACDDFEIKTAWLKKDEEHGLSEEVLNDTDVLLWWGHCHHDEVKTEVVERIWDHVVNKGMGFIPLHSAHMSRPFRRLMGTSCALSWREAEGENAHVWTVTPNHPITAGVPMEFELEGEEMYGEFFDIPKPDDIVFISWYKGGNVFRGGVTFTRGMGKIFYFHPGHETLRSYYNPNVIRVIKNAIYWAAPVVTKKLTLGEWQDPVEVIKK